MNIVGYLKELSNARLTLWAYLIWYVVVTYHYFDPTLNIWLNAIGIALFVGFSLYLNLLSGSSKPGFWQVGRCYLTPFCVSSFSALVKEKGFFLIFSPNLQLNLIGTAVILALVCTVMIIRKRSSTAIS